MSIVCSESETSRISVTAPTIDVTFGEVSVKCGQVSWGFLLGGGALCYCSRRVWAQLPHTGFPPPRRTMQATHSSRVCIKQRINQQPPSQVYHWSGGTPLSRALTITRSKYAVLCLKCLWPVWGSFQHMFVSMCDYWVKINSISTKSILLVFQIRRGL